MAQKKSFKTDLVNPAMQFISDPLEVRGEEIPEGTLQERKEMEETAVSAIRSVPEGYKTNPLYVETKSKRLQLLIQPSLLEKIRGKAKAEGRSVNDFVHSVLEEALRGES